MEKLRGNLEKYSQIKVCILLLAEFCFSFIASELCFSEGVGVFEFEFEVPRVGFHLMNGGYFFER